MTFFHASQIKGIQVLEPRISNHNFPLIYFSGKRENVLVYLSNAVEKTCKEKNFQYPLTHSDNIPHIAACHPV